MKQIVWDRKKQEYIDVTIFKKGIRSFLNINIIGKTLVNYILSIPIINKLITLKMYTRWSKKDIYRMVEKYDIDLREYEKPINEYTTFNDFFIRRLKKDVREIDMNKDTIISSADGQITVYNDITEDGIFNIKGTKYLLSSLIDDIQLSKDFLGGTLVRIFLTPVDYHRFHYPLNCKVISYKTTGGKLLPQNDTGLINGFKPFDSNVRTINLMEHKVIDKFIMIEVGAFYVGRIFQTDDFQGERKKGLEKGYFGLGGSTVILIFKKNDVIIDKDILNNSMKDIPVKIKMGDRIGLINH